MKAPLLLLLCCKRQKYSYICLRILWNTAKRGPLSPLLHLGSLNMITSTHIQEIVNEIVAGSELYLVHLKVTPDNKITIYIDNDSKITVEDCARVSRAVEAKLNRDVEDFELTVSSPGLDEPFKHIRQYQKRIGRQVAVITKEGLKYVGMLEAATDKGIVVQEKKTERVEGKKGKQTIINNINLNFDQIKETKLVVSF